MGPKQVGLLCSQLACVPWRQRGVQGPRRWEPYREVALTWASCRACSSSQVALDSSLSRLLSASLRDRVWISWRVRELVRELWAQGQGQAFPPGLPFHVCPMSVLDWPIPGLHWAVEGSLTMRG